jgi:hypothetical protein
MMSTESNGAMATLAVILCTLVVVAIFSFGVLIGKISGGRKLMPTGTIQRFEITSNEEVAPGISWKTEAVIYWDSDMSEYIVKE